MKDLSRDISYCDKYSDVIQLFWDNDVVQLNKEEAKLLIPVLQNFCK